MRIFEGNFILKSFIYKNSIKKTKILCCAFINHMQLHRKKQKRKKKKAKILN